MNILVIGGDGYLGWPQSMYLSKQGYNVAIIDNLARRAWDVEGGTHSLTPIQTLSGQLSPAATLARRRDLLVSI